jgi:hypothetical protein
MVDGGGVTGSAILNLGHSAKMSFTLGFCILNFSIAGFPFGGVLWQVAVEFRSHVELRKVASDRPCPSAHKTNQTLDLDAERASALYPPSLARPTGTTLVATIHKVSQSIFL